MQAQRIKKKKEINKKIIKIKIKKEIIIQKLLEIK